MIPVMNCQISSLKACREWWQYVTTGKVPAWLYFAKFEGMTEEEAKAMVKEAQPDEPKLFGDE